MRETWTYLANRFPVGDGVCGLSGWVAGDKVVAYECGTEGFDH